MNKIFDIEKGEEKWIVLALIALIVLFVIDTNYTEKAVNDCISSGITEEVCEELRK